MEISARTAGVAGEGKRWGHNFASHLGARTAEWLQDEIS